MQEKNTKKMNKFKLMFVVFAALVVLFTLALIIGFLSDTTNFSFSSVLATFAEPLVWILWILILVGFAVYALIDSNVIGSKRVLKINIDLEDSHFMTEKEIRQNDGYTVTKLSKLKDEKDGIPIYAKASGADVDVIMTKPIHTLVIGSTGSGKTTSFVNPTIEILSRTKTKPCMVITDPKGELYRTHAKGLEDRGYKIFLIDLDDIYYSSRWNPFNEICEKTDKINGAQVQQKNGKYYYDEEEFFTFEEADTKMKIYKQQLKDDIFIDLQDLIYSICPIESKNEPGWQKAARDLIFALALGFWEDFRDGYMTKKQFNLFNIYKTVSQHCTGECEAIKEYFDSRDEFSKVKGLSNTVLVSQDKTLSSYLGEVNQYFSWMADTGISALTSGNDIDFSAFDEQPTALFLKVPDDRQNRHKLVTVLITQMYKALVAKAAQNLKLHKTKDAELLKNCHFILDEFGNMPKLNNLDGIVTVGRSRKIFMNFIIQSYTQLDNKYGKEIAETVKSMCNIKIFIGTDNQATIKEFSEACGKKKSRNISFSEQKEMSISTRAESVPLIYPSELAKLNDPKAGADKMGNSVVLVLGNFPIRAKMTPVFAVKNYNIQEAQITKPPAILFDEADYFYDIAKRNNFIKELNSLESEAEDFTLDILSQLKIMQGEDSCDDEAVAMEVQRIYLSVDKKLAKLKGRISKDDFDKLSKIDIKSRIKFLDSLIDLASEKRDNFLMFDLASVKNFIESSCGAENHM